MNAVKKSNIDVLVQQVCAGDERAFEKLYDDYSAALYGVILKVVQKENVAQDVLQIVMVKIWNKINTFNPDKGTIFTWMLNIARNRAIDELRKMKRSGGGEIQPLSLDVNIGNVTSSDSIKVQEIGVKDLLDKLPEEQKQVMEYLYFKGYTQQEASKELDIPLGTVKSRARIALRDLKKFFTWILFWI